MKFKPGNPICLKIRRNGTIDRIPPWFIKSCSLDGKLYEIIDNKREDLAVCDSVIIDAEFQLHQSGLDIILETIE